jgi:hypothetical protein
LLFLSVLNALDSTSPISQHPTQIFCVATFLTSVSFFGTLISELNEIVMTKASAWPYWNDCEGNEDLQIETCIMKG